MRAVCCVLASGTWERNLAAEGGGEVCLFWLRRLRIRCGRDQAAQRAGGRAGEGNKKGEREGKSGKTGSGRARLLFLLHDGRSGGLLIGPAGQGGRSLFPVSFRRGGVWAAAGA